VLSFERMGIMDNCSRRSTFFVEGCGWGVVVYLTENKKQNFFNKTAQRAGIGNYVKSPNCLIFSMQLSMTI
jgi:hypothetical protein